MESLILKLASAEEIQFGVVTLILLAIFAMILKWIMKQNQKLVEQNQQNVMHFVNQINHQQTKNRECFAANTVALQETTATNKKILELIEKKL